MSDQRLTVQWWDGATVGHLVSRGTIYFVYDEAWLATRHDLSPLSLPFTASAFNGAKGVDGLPGLIADALPEAWGRKVAARDFARRRWGEPSPMRLLAWRGTRGVGALRFVPPLDAEAGGPAGRKLDAIGAAALARGAAEIQRGEPSSVLPQLARGGTAGGAFPKALVVAYPDGSLSVGPPDGMGEAGLVKFDLSPHGDSAPCEHVHALMARAAGIHTVETRLLAEDRRSKRRHLFVRRFDVPASGETTSRAHFQTVSGLLHRQPGELDYRDLFRAAIRLHVAPGELRELARRMIFNVLASNHDDHGKNHAFLYDETRRTWSLAPAYDLTYSPGLLERGMTICGEVWPGSATMESLCTDAGLSRSEYRAAFEQVVAALARWKRLAKQFAIPAPTVAEIASRHRQLRERVD